MKCIGNTRIAALSWSHTRINQLRITSKIFLKFALLAHLQLSFSIVECNKITYVNTWKFEHHTDTTLSTFPPLSISSPPPLLLPACSICHCVQRFDSTSTNFNLIFLLFVRIVRILLPVFSIRFHYPLFFCSAMFHVGNIYGQKVPFARLVACWSCCCLCCCCFPHFPQFFDAAFSLCVLSLSLRRVFRVRQRVRVVHWRARACRDSRWPLLHLFHGRDGGR